MNNFFKWDKNSDQPYIIKDKKFKQQQKKKHLFSYIKMFSLFIFIFPIILIWQFLKHFPKAKTNIGIGVNLDKGKEQFALIEELGVKFLIVRMPLWEINNIDKFVEFIAGFGKDKNILINILQDRENIKNHQLLVKNINIIFNKLSNYALEYQICNAINRTKWGFFSMNEYLEFYQVVQKIRDKKFPQIKLIGPSVIDFEYYYTSSTLFNFKKIKFDIVSALLYVDRRGSPYNRQYGFNLKNKINLLASMVSLSIKTNNQIYITETNWPLTGTTPFAPTSEKECVSEEVYIKYMTAYFNIVKKSNKIKRVYWHQLIAPGYGLVDNRDGKIRKTKAFYSFKKLIT